MGKLFDSRALAYLKQIADKREGRAPQIQPDNGAAQKRIEDARAFAAAKRAGELDRDLVLIIDGLNMFIRDFVIVPTMDVNGEHVGGLVGMIRSIKSLVRDLRPSEVVVAWDGEGGSLRRRNMYSEYKQGRKPRVNRSFDFESPEESLKSLQSQYLRTKSFIELLGIRQVEISDVEADDVIAFMCNSSMHERDKVVVTTDKDMLQLVDAKTTVFSPIKKKHYSCSNFAQELGAIPENYVYVKALLSDTSDHIPGVKGIGQKSMVKMFPFLAEHPTSVEEIVAYAKTHSDKGKRFKSVAESEELLRRNVKLMQLSSPIISVQSIEKIRWQLQKEYEYAPTELKLRLVRDGIQITDADMFDTFAEYHLRSRRILKKETKKDE